MLTKHRAILNRNTQQGEDSPYVEFRQDDEETGVTREIHVMLYGEWIEMGKPDTITVGVVPRDTLNEHVVTKTCSCGTSWTAPVDTCPEAPENQVRERRIMLDKPEDYDAEYGDD